MTTPAVNNRLLAIATSTGQETGYDGVTRNITWQGETVRWIDRRPKSTSNPIRKDGTRKPGAWTRTNLFQTLGTGLFSEDRPGYAFKRRMSGNVTTFRSSEDVDFTMATSLLNDARMKSLSGLSESHMQFNVAAAEARGTISTMTQFAQKAGRGIMDTYNAAKRKGFQGSRWLGSGKKVSRKEWDDLGGLPPNKWQDIPSDYLGYLYGLAPLADDIANGLDQLGDLQKKEMQYGYTIRASRIHVEDYDQLVSPPSSAFPFVCRGKRTSVGRCRYNYVFPDWWIQQTPIVTPFSEAYEMARLSFVLDWVIPVGNWIGAMESAQFDPYFREGFELRVAEEVARGPFRSVTTGVTTGIMSNTDWRIRRYRMHREALGVEQRPTFRTTFPSFKTYLGLSQASQALSLMAQAFNKPPRLR